ncbi:MAG TPA: flagellar assembly protein FliX [Acetobacteraceae bacterium]|nr:flagellar assembly protein FliX [Acetobacteraceae bacterium]
MSLIEGLGAPAPGRLPNRTPRSGTASFTLDTAAESAGTGAAQAAAPPLAVSALALQEVAIDAPRDRAARRHGQALLAALGRLQRHLLGGADAAGSLDELAALAAIVPNVDEPGLAATLHATVLRARVELARRGR